MPRGNPALKLAISMDSDVHAKVIEAASADEVSVSAWLTAAARRALLVRDGLTAVSEWERQHDALTPKELENARRRLAGKQRQRRRTT